jgi:hypothetical protein
MSKVTGAQASSPAMSAKRESDRFRLLTKPMQAGRLRSSRALASSHPSARPGQSKNSTKTRRGLVGNMRLREKLENLRPAAIVRPRVSRPARRTASRKPIDRPTPLPNSTSSAKPPPRPNTNLTALSTKPTWDRCRGCGSSTASAPAR